MVNLNILLHFFENYEQYAAIAYRLNFLKIFVNDVEMYDYSINLNVDKLTISSSVLKNKNKQTINLQNVFPYLCFKN